MSGECYYCGVFYVRVSTHMNYCKVRDDVRFSNAKLKGNNNVVINMRDNITYNYGNMDSFENKKYPCEGTQSNSNINLDSKKFGKFYQNHKSFKEHINIWDAIGLQKSDDIKELLCDFTKYLSRNGDEADLDMLDMVASGDIKSQKIEQYEDDLEDAVQDLDKYLTRTMKKKIVRNYDRGIKKIRDIFANMQL
jgi:hypothetical protein